MKYSRSSAPRIFNLNISALSISAPVGDEAEINRSAGRSPCTGSGRRQLMRQIPPRCLMFQGYDRTVYKMSSVIYTVIISRGALNFRLTCSFNTIPRFRFIPGYFLAESRRGAAGAAGPSPGPSPPSLLVAGAGSRARGTVTGSVGATDPSGGHRPFRGLLPLDIPHRPVLSCPGHPCSLDCVYSHPPLSPEIMGRDGASSRRPKFTSRVHAWARLGLIKAARCEPRAVQTSRPSL